MRVETEGWPHPETMEPEWLCAYIQPLHTAARVAFTHGSHHRVIPAEKLEC